MASPFPGMDPYLEGAEWQSFHGQFAPEIARQLSPQLLPKYFAHTVRRTVMPEAIPQISVEIRESRDRQLVTAIELLSPANKFGRGYADYLQKRDEILLSTAHLLEIDLLSQGRRVPMREPLPPAAYYIFLSRADRRPTAEAWPIHIREPLPRIPVPLLPGDSDAALDLQAAFDAVYDVVGYRYTIDYSTAPPIPLTEQDRVWIEERLRAAGLR